MEEQRPHVERETPAALAEAGQAATRRDEIQEPFVRDMEIPPEEYYPDDYHPELLTEWPVDSDLVIPLEDMPPAMLQGMGENWRDRQAYKKHISELKAEADSGE